MFFAVPILLRSSQAVGADVLLEETIRLVEAPSIEDAVAAAGVLARTLERSYKNAEGREVTWTLEEIDEPQEILDSLRSGAELFSRTLTLSERSAMKRPYP